jgi:hypothetical protein
VTVIVAWPTGRTAATTDSVPTPAGSTCTHGDFPLRAARRDGESGDAFRDLGAGPILGFASATDFATDCLRFSDRTVRGLQADADIFEDDPRLVEAFVAGWIGTGQTRLLRRLRAGAELESFVERAERVTHRQLAREVRFLEKVRETACDPRSCSIEPLPQPRLEADLRRRLEEASWTASKIEEELRQRGLQTSLASTGKRLRASETDPTDGPAGGPMDGPPFTGKRLRVGEAAPAEVRVLSRGEGQPRGPSRRRRAKNPGAGCNRGRYAIPGR